MISGSPYEKRQEGESQRRRCEGGSSDVMWGHVPRNAGRCFQKLAAARRPVLL